MGGAQSSQLREKHVVIIGGGYAGIALANKLMGKCRVTLIDSKDAFHHCIAALRACVEEGYSPKTFIAYGPAFQTSFQRGTVESINTQSKTVTLIGGGQVIGYDYVVIATGSGGSFPSRVSGGEDTAVYINQYTHVYETLRSSRDIVVIGGGAVGLEMAGEIATDYSGSKNVTLMHSGTNIVNDVMLPKFRKGVADQLTSKGVKLILGEKVSNLADLPTDGSSRCTVKTDKGTEVEADYVIVCIGAACNSSAYSTSLDAHCMEDNGLLRVNKYFEVDGLEDVYAIGDCCNVSPSKLGYTAGLQGELLASNMLSRANGKAQKPWKEPGTLMILPVGRNGGMFQIGPFVFGSFISRKLKSEGLFIEKFWKAMKQTPPVTDTSVDDRRGTVFPWRCVLIAIVVALAGRTLYNHCASGTSK